MSLYITALEYRSFCRKVFITTRLCTLTKTLITNHTVNRSSNNFAIINLGSWVIILPKNELVMQFFPYSPNSIKSSLQDLGISGLGWMKKNIVNIGLKVFLLVKFFNTVPMILMTTTLFILNMCAFWSNCKNLSVL